ncbi:MAG: winged helix DNA-binding domain-containing protein [Cytophagales bacterium]|nr:winged helix DNA-binding domain-containing protein [Cytophaga sp.]
MELDTTIFNKSNDIIISKLEGGKYLRRPALKAAQEHKNIVADGIRLSCIMMYAELEGIICIGPRDGKQFTYALLDERVPAVKKLDREEALSKLTTCYFTSRGPATIQDYTTWSGLTVKDAKQVMH